MIPSIEPPVFPTSEPSPRPPDALPAPRDNRHVVGGIWLIVLAVLLFLCGGCSTLFYMVIPLTTQANATETVSGNVVFGALAGVGMLLGALLLWQGIVTALDRQSISAARALPPFGILLLVFVGAVMFGFATLTLRLMTAYTFPPWHFMAALLPPVTLLAYAARRLGKTSGLRALLVSFSWGALGATLSAFIVELLLGAALLLAVAVALSLAPEGQRILLEAQRVLIQIQRTQDPTPLLDVLSNPWVTTGLIIYFAGIIPPVEEALKALVVALIDPLKTRRSDALLWGIAAGAGFAMMENMLNSTVEPTGWAFLVILRVGAAIVHVTNGANMGLGWYAARAEGRWARLVIAYLVSMAYHAAWNATAIFLSTGPAGIGLSSSPIDLVTMVALLGFLFILALVGLAWTVHAIRREHQNALASP